MQGEIKRIRNLLDEQRNDLFSLYSKLDANKNQKSREEILNAQLKVMNAMGILDALLEKIEKAKAKKGGA
jgi:hypothetical protein